MKQFKVIGPANERLSLRLEHPLHLDPKKTYSLALNGLYGRYCLQNNPKGLYYILHVKDVSKGPYGDMRKCLIPSGNYTIEQIERFVIDSVKQLFPTAITSSDKERLYYVRIDPFTQKIEFKLPVDIHLFPDFSDNSLNLGHFLGFESASSIYYLPDRVHKAQFLPKLVPYNVIEIHCNLVEPTLTNHDELSHSHQETDLLYVCHPSSTRYGSTMSVKPVSLSWVPINKSIHSIQDVELEIKNELGKKLNFGSEKLIVYLLLRENEKS